MDYVRNPEFLERWGLLVGIRLDRSVERAFRSRKKSFLWFERNVLLPPFGPEYTLFGPVGGLSDFQFDVAVRLKSMFLSPRFKVFNCFYLRWNDPFDAFVIQVLLLSAGKVEIL